MPYIHTNDRKRLRTTHNDYALIAGHLNYQITMLCKDYIRMCGENYKTYNDLIGALECAKLELYRRKTAPYEDTKIAENGDVW